MESEFSVNEDFLRGVFLNGQNPNVPDFWEPDGSISSAAFKDRRGLSVDRTGDRSLEESVDYAVYHLKGAIVAVSYITCCEAKAKPMFLPTPDNPYHSEIHQSESVRCLSSIQARYFKDHCRVLYIPQILVT